MRKIFILSLFAICLFGAHGQVAHLNRYEVENKWENVDYVVISNEHKGLMLVKPLALTGGKNFRIEFSHLDTDLNDQWTGFFETSNGQSLRGYHYHDNVTYLLFQVRSDSRYIKIVALDAMNRAVKTYEPKQIVDLDISEFEAIKGSAVVGGYIEGRPAVFVYDMEADVVRTLPNVYQNNSELLEVRINSDSVTFNVTASQLDEKKDRTILVNTYDYEGNVVRGYELETETNHQLTSAISSSIIDKAQVVVGLYSIKTGTYPSGFYINHVDRTGRQTMKYLNFGEFDTFLEHTGKRRFPKMKERALAAKKRNKEWRYKTDAIFREMIEVEGKLVVCGEFFKPWTVTTSGNWRNWNRFNRPGSFIDPSLNSFAGRNPGDFGNISGRSDFNFTHAFAFTMDLNGDVLWDGSFDINENPESSLENFGAFQFHNDEGHYAYYYDKELVVKQLNDKDDKEGTRNALTLLEESDELKLEKDRYRGVTRWYDNKFLIYGVQHVKPSNKSSGMRKVFFINSVEVGSEEAASKLD